ncbi:MAG TPA: HD-GYP domain-containing protein, partial [Bryobacterales bacterium]|nr:HD-GYP domain-containing protein [Bryobacterales bacterium]
MNGRSPNYNSVLLMLAALVGISIFRGWFTVALMALPIFFLVLHSSQLHTGKLSAERRHSHEIDQLHLRTIEALAVAIDAKDNTTHQHLERVVVYAEAIGKEMGLAENELRALHAAALLHDIGKLAVPEYIISKPGRLTEEEFEKMKIHTVVGAEILERVQFPYPVVPIVRSHHERWNGTGYPDGLKGEEIPVGARILSVVDSFDALSSDRQYRRALSPEKAMAAIKKDAGTLYDPKIVEVMDQLYPSIEPLVKEYQRPDVRLSTRLKIEKGAAPRAGLSVEKAGDTSSALYSIVQAREELRVLYDITQALGNSLSVDETLRLLAEQLQKLIHYDAIAIYLIRDGKLIPRF